MIKGLIKEIIDPNTDATCSVSLSNIGSDNLLTTDWLYNGVILLEDTIFFNATKVE